MAKRKKWSDLTPRQQRLVTVGGVIELVLTFLASRDLKARADEQIRGRRWVWWLAMPVQPVGPLAYLLWGRRRD